MALTSRLVMMKAWQSYSNHQAPAYQLCPPCPWRRCWTGCSITLHFLSFRKTWPVTGRWSDIQQTVFRCNFPRLQSVNPIQPGLFGVKTVVAYSTLKMRNLKTISPFLRGEREIWISFLEKRKRNHTKFSQLSKREKYCPLLNFESKNTFLQFREEKEEEEEENSLTLRAEWVK